MNFSLFLAAWGIPSSILQLYLPSLIQHSARACCGSCSGTHCRHCSFHLALQANMSVCSQTLYVPDPALCEYDCLSVVTPSMYHSIVLHDHCRPRTDKMTKIVSLLDKIHDFHYLFSAGRPLHIVVANKICSLNAKALKYFCTNHGD